MPWGDVILDRWNSRFDVLAVWPRDPEPQEIGVPIGKQAGRATALAVQRTYARLRFSTKIDKEHPNQRRPACAPTGQHDGPLCE
jgi:hypothetical protein